MATPVGTVVEFNRGAGKEYGIVLDHDEAGDAIIGVVQQAEDHSYKLATDGSPSGGQYAVVK
jgi:hypothetical protein